MRDASKSSAVKPSSACTEQHPLVTCLKASMLLWCFTTSTAVKLDAFTHSHMQYFDGLAKIVASRFPNDTTLPLIGQLNYSTFGNYSGYIQIAMGVAKDFVSANPDFSIEDMLGIIPTNPTLISMVKYVLNRMEAMAAMKPTSNSPTSFNPILELNNTAARRIGVDFALNFAGMLCESSC